MSMWLYQINQKNWSPERYRLEIWENEKWVWQVGKKILKENQIKRGDTLVFFSTPSSGSEPGFYGLAIILEWKEDVNYIYFRPTASSDFLKMFPWWDKKAKMIVDKIRGNMKQATLWYIPEDLGKELKEGIHTWITHGIEK